MSFPSLKDQQPPLLCMDNRESNHGFLNIPCLVHNKQCIGVFNFRLFRQIIYESNNVSLVVI